MTDEMLWNFVENLMASRAALAGLLETAVSDCPERLGCWQADYQRILDAPGLKRCVRAALSPARQAAERGHEHSAEQQLALLLELFPARQVQ